MRAKTISAVLVGICLAASGASAQGFWTKKPWQKWSKDECKKMLTNSPWGQTWSKLTIENTPIGQRSDATGRNEDPTVYYFVELRSALPVRQAIAREAQIENKYDTADDKQKKVIDDSVNSYLARPYDDIVVHLDYNANVEVYERDLVHYWQSFAPGVVPEQTYLINSRGDKIVPRQMIVAKGGENGIEFIFPRLVNNQSVIQPGDKSFSFQFVAPPIGPLAEETAFVEFKTDKMKLDGQLVY
ncbi:MAG TPA: hypothetical protein VGT03_12995 [Candidatus Acidoferrales bacterium]|nr:hypothetical protein [Candidatus Acidoferrales bacterium]